MNKWIAGAAMLFAFGAALPAAAQDAPKPEAAAVTAPAPAADAPAAAAPVAAPAAAVAAGPVEVRVPDIGDFKDVAVIEMLVKV
eukprot:gene20001-39586_t